MKRIKVNINRGEEYDIDSLMLANTDEVSELIGSLQLYFHFYFDRKIC